MSEDEAVVYLRWIDGTSVATLTLISYDYLLLLDKEVQYFWQRSWSVMSCLYLVVRYFGLFLALYVVVVVFFILHVKKRC
ncbi:uncharacterized protein EDB91DRAFT_1115779 [Suillus paluster]|uniref:uncharacterized protein n=1 Tax=Suillus paluster TaxID=48578 RepID=UPI001B87C843|nr:uncharacterized protein EDB91DRAFT_1115779 [Suillus paluster]KAG1747972.1 hypothetical protein EDB91DRAFT_1115779 [Suillus paluster]